MLQRPQSIFLLVLILAMLLMTLVPIWTKTGEGVIYMLNAWCFQEVSPAGKLVKATYFPYALMGLLAFGAVGVATYEVFRYDNRALQLKLGALNGLIMVAVLGLILYLSIQEESQLLPDVPGKYRLGFFMPAIAIVSNLLANRFINKDEKLVKSAERMR